jgi:hypothetical protein
MENETTRDSIAARGLQQLAVSQNRSGGIPKHEKTMHQTFRVTDRDLLRNEHAGPQEKAADYGNNGRSHGLDFACKWDASTMIRKLTTGKYRLYSRKVDPKTGKRRNLGTFASRAAAERHERAVQFFKRHG